MSDQFTVKASRGRERAVVTASTVEPPGRPPFVQMYTHVGEQCLGVALSLDDTAELAAELQQMVGRALRRRGQTVACPGCYSQVVTAAGQTRMEAMAAHLAAEPDCRMLWDQLVTGQVPS